MEFALALAWENKRLLLGESLPERVLVTGEVTPDQDLDAADVDSHISDIERRLHDANSDVNYPGLLGLTASLRTGLPVSTTRCAGTESVPIGSAVSAGIELE
jgi:hypothetical protein